MSVSVGWLAAALAGKPVAPLPKGRLVLIGAGASAPPLHRLVAGAQFVNVCASLEQPPHTPLRNGDHNVLQPAPLRCAPRGGG